MTAFALYPLQLWPIDAVLAVQAKAYAPHLIERAEVLQGKVRAAWPDKPLSWGVRKTDAGDHVARADTLPAAAVPGGLCGYAIACPWRSGEAPCWNALALPPVHQADCLYVHDIAIDPRYQGQGLAEQLMNKVLQQGRACGWKQAVLVAVQGAQRYWERYGFEAASSPAAPEALGFGADAVWMQRTL